MIIKLNKYLNAGVREYWIIDPDQETVTVYDFEHDQFPIHYTFEDTVPVMIWEGNCQIDFREIRDNIAFIYENEAKNENAVSDS
jgi:Uma2 family endonuclease